MGMCTDLIAVSRDVERHVCVEKEGVHLRRYYRFRLSRHYGGSAVGDVVGCNFNCVYCWCWRINRNLEIGSVYSPEAVVENLLTLARSANYYILRLSGGEPTLCFNHLLQVLEHFSRARRDKEVFVLETNGFVLGLEKKLVEELARYRDLVVVRVSLKGCSEEEFSRLTGLDSSVYRYQLKALENLDDHGISYSIAVPISFCTKKSFAILIETLVSLIGEKSVDRVEPEVLIMYPSVARRLCRKSLRPWLAVDPSRGVKLRESDIRELFRKLCSENNYGEALENSPGTRI